MRRPANWDTLVDLYWSDSLWGYFVEKRYKELETFIGMVEQILSTRKAELERDMATRPSGLPPGIPVPIWLLPEQEQRLVELADVFPQELYRSAIASAYGYLENIYGLICSEAADERGLPPPEAFKKENAKANSVTAINGNGIQFYKKYARNKLNADFPQDDIWGEVVVLGTVRNACLHAAGRLQGTKLVSVEGYCRKHPDHLKLVRTGLQDKAFVKLTPDYCRYVLDLCVRFLKVAQGEVWLTNPR